MIFVKWAFLNLFRHKRRNFTTAMTIAAALTGLLLLWSYIYRTDRYLTDATVYVNRNGHLTVNKVDALSKEFQDPAKFSLSLVQRKKIEEVVAKDARVEKYGSILTGTALIGNGCKSYPTFIKSVDPDLDSYIYNLQEVKTWIPELAVWKLGKGFYQDAESENSINVSYGLAQLLRKTKVFAVTEVEQPDCEKPETIEKDNNVQISALNYEKDFSAIDASVVGSFSTGFYFLESSFTLMPLKKAQKLFDTENVSRVVLFLKDASLLESTYKDLKAKLALADTELEINKFDHPEIGLFYTGTMQFLYTMAGFFLFLIILAILFSIGNQMTLSVVERSKEIGTLFSIGYSRTFVKKLFLIESLFVNILGSVIGLAFSYLIIFVINELRFPFYPPGIAGQMIFKLYLPLNYALVLFLILPVLCLVGAHFILKSKLKGNIVRLLSDSVT